MPAYYYARRHLYSRNLIQRTHGQSGNIVTASEKISETLWILGPTGPWQDQTIAWPTHPRKADTLQRIVTTYYGIGVLPPLQLHTLILSEANVLYISVQLYIYWLWFELLQLYWETLTSHCLLLAIYTTHKERREKSYEKLFIKKLNFRLH